MWPGIAASSAVLVLGAASTPELWVQVRLSYGSDLWVYPTIYHSTEDFCPFLFLFKGPDRIQGYMDTPDTIRSIRVDTAECTSCRHVLYGIADFVVGFVQRYPSNAFFASIN
mgnify:CR=1 FL=1